MAGTTRWISLLAPALRPLYELVAERVAGAREDTAVFRQASSYRELSGGDYDFAWVCGLPYVEAVDELVAALTPVAAPVPAGKRYGGRPIYYSDVVVAASSRHESLNDLRGTRWAYNEPGSHSGYLATLHRLTTMGEDVGYFGEWVRVGFHEEAVRAVARGEVDGAAIDSHLLGVILEEEPALRSRLRVVDSIGPSTIQPLVAAPHVPEATVAAVRSVVLGLGRADHEREVMQAMQVERFVAVEDADYDDIRAKLDQVRMAGLWTAPRPAGLRLVAKP